MSDAPERDLQKSLRNVAAVGLLAFLGLIAGAAVIVPVLAPQAQLDTTLLLGLAGSFVGALLMLLGIQTVLTRNGK